MESEATLQLRGIREIDGTAVAVQRQLGEGAAARDDSVVAFVLPRALDRHREVIAKTIRMLVEITSELAVRRDREVLDSLVAALMPATTLSTTVQQEAAMIVSAREAVLESTHWLTAREIAEYGQYSGTYPQAQPSRWKQRRRIFAIRPDQVDLFPNYGLDPQNRYRPLPALAKVLEVFKGHKDGWDIAYWFASVNSFLGGKLRPQDLLKNSPDLVIQAVEDEIAGVTHG